MVENQKVCRVIEEFSLYLLEAEVEDLNIKVSKTENRFSILFSCQKIADNLLEELDEIFKRNIRKSKQKGLKRNQNSHRHRKVRCSRKF